MRKFFLGNFGIATRLGGMNSGKRCGNIMGEKTAVKNLNINSVIAEIGPPITPKKPVNVEALGKLAALYAEITWLPTAENCCELGMRYWEAWGVMPSGMRLKASWKMPDYHRIMYLFGDVKHYHV